MQIVSPTGKHERIGFVALVCKGDEDDHIFLAFLLVHMVVSFPRPEDITVCPLSSAEIVVALSSVERVVALSSVEQVVAAVAK